ncbi:hypothetical protein BBP40_005429 [Aspergillus hancockii]|nr:hypothetical protein BBP40_005429 [Aspergillus hancockii]
MEILEEVDVLIIGAGPAGLMAAAWMATTGVKTIIVDQKPCRTLTGHADGLESRTLEILASFGLAEVISSEANPTIELCLWDVSLAGGIERRIVRTNCNPGISKYDECTLGQARIEEHLLGFLQQHENIRIMWSTNPLLMEDRSTRKHWRPSSYPTRVILETTEQQTNKSALGKEAAFQTLVKAKYLLGCDGAHSWVRNQLHLSLDGDQTDEHWGVIDSVPITNFRELYRPFGKDLMAFYNQYVADIRKRCIIKSGSGNLMIIPREGKLVRVYIQLTPAAATSFNQNHHIDTLLSVTQEILRPYSFHISHLHWSTIYTVGRRLCRTFSKHNRVFLAGDAIHTHSPKAGQGMNVSLQDAYNLGWKLASVIQGAMDSRILETYQKERFPVAERLLSFDERICGSICYTMDMTRKSQNLSYQQELETALEEENSSASGLTVRYKDNLLITAVEHSDFTCTSHPLPLSKQGLARNIIVGTRFPNQQVISQSDARPCQLQEQLVSSGQWHLIAFAGNIAEEGPDSRLQQLASLLGSSDRRVQKLIRSASESLVASVAVYLVHSAPRNSVELTDLPDLFTPFNHATGYDYTRVFADSKSHRGSGGDAYKSYGITPEGCLVLVRPDQHTAFIGCLTDVDALDCFFARFVLA